MKRTPPAIAALTALLLAVGLTACAPDQPKQAKTPTPAPSTSATAAGPALAPELSRREVAALPAAVYDAVIPGLVAGPEHPQFGAAHTVGFDAAVYGDDFATPVARIPAKNFLGTPSVIVPVATRGAWSLVLTPSRQVLPSAVPEGTTAPAQTAGWMPTHLLRPLNDLPKRVVVSVSEQTLTVTDADGTIVETFPVGVGTDETPTPTGVTGYLQARYLDPAQGQSTHRIQLTSLHATGDDEPFAGSDGGLIGMHYQDAASGAVSHGCIRLGTAAITAVDALPLGTPIQIAG
ncbi:hypothetical protein GCM10027406_01240 [Leifsonia lichenia]